LFLQRTNIPQVNTMKFKVDTKCIFTHGLHVRKIFTFTKAMYLFISDISFLDKVATASDITHRQLDLKSGPEQGILTKQLQNTTGTNENTQKGKKKKKKKKKKQQDTTNKANDSQGQKVSNEKKTANSNTTQLSNDVPKKEMGKPGQTQKRGTATVEQPSTSKQVPHLFLSDPLVVSLA